VHPSRYPWNHDPADGIARWKHGLALMGRHANVAIKVSNFGAYSLDKSIPALRETVLTCIDAFGTGRAMFGTDYPVARRHMTLAGMIDAFAAIIAELTETEQQAVFHNNAQRLDRFRDE
jgi:predicted TIM-barrel fold metal-dependent hydrolase